MLSFYQIVETRGETKSQFVISDASGEKLFYAVEKRQKLKWLSAYFHSNYTINLFDNQGDELMSAKRTVNYFGLEV